VRGEGRGCEGMLWNVVASNVRLLFSRSDTSLYSAFSCGFTFFFFFFLVLVVLGLAEKCCYHDWSLPCSLMRS